MASPYRTPQLFTVQREKSRSGWMQSNTDCLPDFLSRQPWSPLVPVSPRDLGPSCPTGARCWTSPVALSPLTPGSIPRAARKAFITEAHTTKHEGGRLRFHKQQLRCSLPFQHLSWKPHLVQRRGFCLLPKVGRPPSGAPAVSASFGSETTVP